MKICDAAGGLVIQHLVEFSCMSSAFSACNKNYI